MSIPITGYVLIPIGLIAAFLPWRFSLIVLAIFAMMVPAAVVNIGSFGLQPGYYLALLLIARVWLEIAMNRFTFNAAVLASMQPLFWFAITCLLVLFIALCFFQGIETLPGSSAYVSSAAQPFHLARENFTQLFYLTVNIGLVYLLGHYGARQSIATLLAEWDRALVIALCFAVFVCLWQFVGAYAGVPFPKSFFYSNAYYAASENQTYVGFNRINGPFSEPSALGYTFTGYLLFAWLRYRLYPTAFSAVVITLTAFCMLVSTSTTAYFGLFLVTGAVLFDIVSGRISLLTSDFKLSSGQIAFIFIGIVGILGGSILIASNWTGLVEIARSAILEKGQSTSFQQRSYADYLALQILVQTYGVGLGLGSHRANSLLLTLLSNTGVIGTLTFAAFIYGLLRPAALGKNASLNRQLRRSVAPFQWGLIGLLLIHGFSNPNLSLLVLWQQIGCVISLKVALRKSGVLGELPEHVPSLPPALVTARALDP